MVLSRLFVLKETMRYSAEQFEMIDALHYEVDNKLWNLLKSLEEKKGQGTWVNRVSDSLAEYDAQ